MTYPAVIQVAPRLYVGDRGSCRKIMGENVELPVDLLVPHSTVHACKHPCFKDAVGPDVGPGHPDYLGLELGGDLYLNMIDPEEPLFKLELFAHALRFIRDRLTRSRGPVLIHCNAGMSRSPIIAMLYLIEEKVLPYSHFDDATRRFCEIYPKFNPGRGIQTFCRANWQELTDYARTKT